MVKVNLTVIQVCGDSSEPSCMEDAQGTPDLGGPIWGEPVGWVREVERGE